MNKTARAHTDRINTLPLSLRKRPQTRSFGQKISQYDEQKILGSAVNADEFSFLPLPIYNISDIILLKLTRYDIHEQVQSHSLNRHLVFVTALKPLIKSPTVSLLLGSHPKGSVKPGKLSSRPCPNLSHDLCHSAKHLKQNSSGLLVCSILFNHFAHKILGVAMRI